MTGFHIEKSVNTDFNLRGFCFLCVCSNLIYNHFGISDYWRGDCQAHGLLEACEIIWSALLRQPQVGLKIISGLKE